MRECCAWPILHFEADWGHVQEFSCGIRVIGGGDFRFEMSGGNARHCIVLPRLPVFDAFHEHGVRLCLEIQERVVQVFVTALLVVKPTAAIAPVGGYPCCYEAGELKYIPEEESWEAEVASKKEGLCPGCEDAGSTEINAIYDGSFTPRSAESGQCFGYGDLELLARVWDSLSRLTGVRGWRETATAPSFAAKLKKKASAAEVNGGDYAKSFRRYFKREFDKRTQRFVGSRLARAIDIFKRENCHDISHFVLDMFRMLEALYGDTGDTGAIMHKLSIRLAKTVASDRKLRSKRRKEAKDMYTRLRSRLAHGLFASDLEEEVPTVAALARESLQKILLDDELFRTFADGRQAGKKADDYLRELDL